MFKTWLKLNEDANSEKLRQLLKSNGFRFYTQTSKGEQWEKDGVVVSAHVHSIRSPHKMLAQMFDKYEKIKSEQQRLRNKRINAAA